MSRRITNLIEVARRRRLSPWSVLTLTVLLLEHQLVNKISGFLFRRAFRSHDKPRFLAAVDTINENGCASLSSTMATSVVLKIAYDGLHFYGWTAGNAYNNEEDDDEYRPIPYSSLTLATRSRRRSYRRNGMILSYEQQLPNRVNTNIRTVQKTFEKAFAKMYGDVPLHFITVEGCSRTDRGVSAKNLVAHVYCSKTINNITTARPISPTDPNFETLPFRGDLQQIIYVLNRMIPMDVRVTDASYMPSSTEKSIFHPTLSAVSKTYQYKFSVPQPGNIYDPLQWRHMWNIQPSSYFDCIQAQQVCQLFLGTHDFQAFQGALRGSDRHQGGDSKANTVCTISKLRVEEEELTYLKDGPPAYFMDRGMIVGSTKLKTTTYVVTLTGNRFLYKMCRFIVGVILAAGCGKITPVEIQNALQSGTWEESLDEFLAVSTNESRLNSCHQQQQKFQCAPAHGLLLSHVEYPDDISPKWLHSK